MSDSEFAKIKDSFFSAIVDGTTIKGNITIRKPQFIEVEIISPYQGVKTGSSTIPLFALQYKNYILTDGDLEAVKMLIALYKFCKYANKHLLELTKALLNYQKEIHYSTYLDPIMIENKEKLNELNSVLLKQKKELKDGIIDSHTYQLSIKPIKKQIVELKYETEIDKYSIFNKSFADFIATPIFKVNQDTVIKYLESLGSCSC